MQAVDHQVVDLHLTKMQFPHVSPAHAQSANGERADSQRSNRKRTEGKRANGSRARSDRGNPHGRQRKIASLQSVSASHDLALRDVFRYAANNSWVYQANVARLPNKPPLDV
jgi:hypothetical protein